MILLLAERRIRRRVEEAVDCLRGQLGSDVAQNAAAGQELRWRPFSHSSGQIKPRLHG